MDVRLDPNPEGPAETIVANLRGWIPLFAQLPEARLEHDAGCSWWTTAIRVPLFCGAIGIPKEGNLQAAIDRVLVPFDEGAIPLLWVTPLRADVTACLEARGFRIGQIPGMAIDLASLVHRPATSGISVREVDDDPHALGEAARIALSTNGFPEEVAAPYLDALGRFPERARVHTFLATVDGVPASTATLLEWAGVAGLYNVGTLEPFRGRGFGAIVSSAALEAGRVAGHRTAVLQASAMGAPIYRGLGFEETCRFSFAIRTPGADPAG